MMRAFDHICPHADSAWPRAFHYRMLPDGGAVMRLTISGHGRTFHAAQTARRQSGISTNKQSHQDINIKDIESCGPRATATLCTLHQKKRLPQK